MKNLKIITLLLSILLLISNYPTHHSAATRRIPQQEDIETIKDTVPKSPVILVPGFGGSRLDVKLTNFKSEHWFCHTNEDWFLLWLSMDMLVPVFAECSIDYITLDWDGSYPSNKEGVEFRVVSGIEGVVYLQPTFHFENYFLNLVNEFKNEGYQENLDLFAAPYDFRLSPKNFTLYFNELKNMVEYSYKIDNKKVNLVCHSMGCKLSTFFLTQTPQEWKDKYVEQLITIAPAVAGAFEGIRTLLFGNNFGDDILPNKDFKTLSLSWPAVYFNLPYDDTLWTNPIAIFKDKEYYSTNEGFHQLFTDMELPEKAHQLLDFVWDDNQYIKNPGVKVSILYGYGSDTHSQLIFKDKMIDGSIEYIDKSGDGVLLEELILNYCEQWTDNTSTSCQGFKGVCHQCLVSNKDVIKSVVGRVKQQ
ncbi:phosphatidylcholine-sterol acyltransferase [Anaeramoeba flamelloides]|uniref:Phosphatidylcholine-sterol acyltransferase n=1 Tax=Anaeramoeba flamelloides TaxID=1746091 RepID=A0ABQ8Y504_9EUKA|nr:phosphatidylcholine-sterol acyltransferase [Anaeramoeba flamelloides]